MNKFPPAARGELRKPRQPQAARTTLEWQGEERTRRRRKQAALGGVSAVRRTANSSVCKGKSAAVQTLDEKLKEEGTLEVAGTVRGDGDGGIGTRRISNPEDRYPAALLCGVNRHDAATRRLDTPHSIQRVDAVRTPPSHIRHCPRGFETTSRPPP